MLKSQPGGLALDFVRSQVNGKPMITQQQMTLLPKPGKKKGLSEHDQMMVDVRAAALQNAVVTLLNMAITDKAVALFMRLGARMPMVGRWMGSTIFI